MSKIYNTLILGASYGSLLGTKLAMAGHDVTLVCTAGTAALINEQGTVVRFPVRGLEEAVVVRSGELTGSIKALVPEAVDVQAYNLVVLGMQEPQYSSSPDVRELTEKLAAARVPCMAIMNMPPLPYMQRLPGLDAGSLLSCYKDASVWQQFEPGLVTLASPDPQAYRPEDAGKNVLQVSLPTNFKVARFESEAHTEMLRTLEADILAIRHTHGESEIELPVKLKVHDSLYVPLAKWSMLMTGNYRCVQRDGMIPICDAVLSDQEASKAVYEWTASVCVAMGAEKSDLVPFEKYANAAKGLSQPSSAAKALARGVASIERVDKLIQLVAAQHGFNSPVVDEIVGNVQWYLDNNAESSMAKAG
ncbi:hypothetical protein AB833_04265 [Chromatiales bacterium (ex Bugula neritina AB1)]|nr:hypothetical protein AB833_04265 [Chromatiales bacterium (ex Bugula neritina AB1)]